MAGTVVVDLTAKDNVSQTLNKIDGQAKKLNKTFVDSQGKLRDANGRFLKMSKTAGTARQSFKLLGTTFSTYLAPLVAFGAAVKAVTDSLGVFSQREKDTAALANGLRGMTTDGKAALESLKQSADELGKATLFDEEDFTKGFKLLTSFKTIGVSSYDEVAKTAADMATVLDQDVSSVLLQVAKALEAPDVGLTALQRSGTRFTDQQKKQVKAMVTTNRTAEAQAFILKELQRQYGGASQAAAKGFAGAMDTLGEETRDAMEALGKFVEPAVVAAIKAISNGIKGLSNFFQTLANAALPQVQKALAPILTTMRNIFQQINFQAVANIIGNVLVNGVTAFFNVLSLITPVLAKISEGLFFLLQQSPFARMVQSIMAVAEHLGLTQPLVNQLQTGAEGAANKFKDIPPAIDAAAEAQKRKIEMLKAAVDLAENEKQKVKEQEQAYQNSLNVTDARLKAESAINQMQRQSLEIAYEQAGSAKQRLEIAKRIFRNEVEAASIAFQQAMNSIEAEKMRLEFRRQAAQVELQIIQAKGELAAAEADSTEKAQLILEKTKKLADAQRKSIKVLNRQIKAQSKIAEHQTTAAKAQLKAAVQTSEQELNQRLVSKEINMSRKQADRLSRSYGNSARASLNLSNNTMRVSNNAQRSYQFFLKVQSSATTAANAIHKAAAAQERFNRAKAGKSSSKSTSNRIFPDTQQAEGGYNRGSFKAFARGGVVNGPTLGLIGEGGEREYIIPESKAAGFASNYLQGQRGASAIPGFAEGGTVGPINIQTGPVMQQNGQNFVTVEQFTQGMSDLASAITASSRSYGGRRYMGVI